MYEIAVLTILFRCCHWPIRFYCTKYNLIISKAKKLKIKNILLGHHLDDLFENFFIRILRGSGLNGLISLDQKTQIDKINILRPLLNFEKKDLIYISEYVFGSYVEDPSNINEKFKRVMPPIELLSKIKHDELILKLKELDFFLEKNIAA